MLRGMFSGLLVLLLLMAGVRAADAPAPVLLPAVFSDHMVLQRDVKLPVWGKGKPGAKYIISLAGINAEAAADGGGEWKAFLPPFPAGGPHKLTVSGPEGKQVVSDVMVGDVWLCSGQSNMAMTVNRCNNADAEIAASADKDLRMMTVARVPGFVPLDHCSGNWQTAGPDAVGGWSAVGYFFGRDLRKQLHVPVGLINASWGGTRVEAWASREVLATLPGTEKDLADAQAAQADYEQRKEQILADQKAWDDAKTRLAAIEKDAAHQQKYAAADFDDSGWGEMNTPGDWDSQGFKGAKGEAWYRRVVEIPAGWAGKDLELSPGAADEIESSYYNGSYIGRTGSVEPFNPDRWNVQRVYKVPAALVKAGRAVIAVRVANLVAEGGLRSNGDAGAMYLKPAGSTDEKDRLSLAGTWKFGFALQMPPQPVNAGNPNTACVLFNGMIHPLIPFPVKGVIWYQGESNANNAYDYRVRFPAMIKDWRTRWGQELPFFWVQLANYRAPQKDPVSDNWAVLRESQEKTLALPKTGTALAIDIGEEKDIHPKDKQTVGARLALAARAIAYGEKNLVASGPRYQSMQAEGGKIRLRFESIGGGLVAKDGVELKRFSIAGADRQFVWAKAKIEGDTVLVWADEVTAPKAVRYAYETNPAGCNLYNNDGLPASPFRTDNWLVVTQPAQPDDEQK